MDIFFMIFCIFILLLSLTREISYFKWVNKKIPFLMQLVPMWSFFAPRPGMHDYHLVYRWFSNSQSKAKWREAINYQPTFFSWIWNPQKKDIKALNDLSLELLRACHNSSDDRAIITSVPYLVILNHINSIINFKNGKIEFMILRDTRLDNYEVVFRSQTHPI